MRKKLRVNELLANVNTHRHPLSELNIQMACMNLYADQDVLDAKQVFCDEYMSWVIPRTDRSKAL